MLRKICFIKCRIKNIGKVCHCNVVSLYQYFDNLDALITKATAQCKAKVEDDFIALALKKS